MSAGTLDDVLRVAAFAKRYPDVASEGALRWQIFNSDKNGLDDAEVIFRVGRCVYIHSGRYFNWLLAHGKGSDSVSDADN